jgi:Acyltransferase family
MTNLPSSSGFKAQLSEDLYLIRGIAIMWVVMGHVIGFDRNYGMRQLYNSDLAWLGWIADLVDILHIPVFLIASGIAARLFSRTQLGYRQFFRSKFQRLLVPLLIWSPCYFIFQSLNKGRSITVLDVLQATVQPYEIFWFLHALVFAVTFRFICSKLWHQLTPYYGLSIGLAIISWHPQFHGLIIYTYWNLFFIFGMAIAPRLAPLKGQIRHWKPLTLGVSFALSFVVLVMVKEQFPRDLQLYIARLLDGPIAFFMLYIGLELGRIHQWLRRFPWLKPLVQQVGMLSMVIYLFHGYFTRSAAIIIGKASQGTQPLLPELHFLILSLAGIVFPLLLYHRVLKRSALLTYLTGGGSS